VLPPCLYMRECVCLQFCEVGVCRMMHVVHCALCAVHCALCAVHCVLCDVHCMLFTVCCALCAVHCALCAVCSLLMPVLVTYVTLAVYAATEDVPMDPSTAFTLVSMMLALRFAFQNLPNSIRHITEVHSVWSTAVCARVYLCAAFVWGDSM
jgi:hypothetical protein